MKTTSFWQRHLQKAHICSWYDYATQLVMSEEAVCLDYDEQSNVNKRVSQRQ